MLIFIAICVKVAIAVTIVNNTLKKLKKLIEKAMNNKQ